MRVLIPDPVIVELIQNSLLDHYLYFGVDFGSYLLADLDACLELQVVLQQTVDWPLSGLDLSPQNPVFLADYLLLKLLNLLLKLSLFFNSLFLVFVLEFDLSEVVELVINHVFPFIILLALCLLVVFSVLPALWLGFLLELEFFL